MCTRPMKWLPVLLLLLLLLLLFLLLLQKQQQEQPKVSSPNFGRFVTMVLRQTEDRQTTYCDINQTFECICDSRIIIVVLPVKISQSLKNSCVCRPMYVFTDALAEVANCSFPYTFHGGLYYGCLANAIPTLACACLGHDFGLAVCNACPGMTAVMSFIWTVCSNALPY